MVYVKKEGDTETIKIKGDRCYHYIGVKKEEKKSEQEQISKWRIAFSIPNIIGTYGTEEIEGTVEDVYKFIYENELEMLVNVITRVNNSYNFIK